MHLQTSSTCHIIYVPAPSQEPVIKSYFLVLKIKQKQYANIFKYAHVSYSLFIRAFLYFCLVNNECKTNPCDNDNICISEQNGYSCQCLSGYSGANCDIPPNFCKVNGCKNNAACVSHFANYSCICDSNCTGTFCETQIGKSVL